MQDIMGEVGPFNPSLSAITFGTYDTFGLKTNDDNHKNLRIYRTIKVGDIVRAQQFEMRNRNYATIVKVQFQYYLVVSTIIKIELSPAEPSSWVMRCTARKGKGQNVNDHVS